MTELIGTWSLLECVSFRDGVGTPTFGDPPSGQIQYGADGRMSAFLMDPSWARRGDSAARGLTDFFAYAGDWRVDGDRVTHHILFASQPRLVGTDFVRRIEPMGDGRMSLLTLPETSRSGHVYETRLLWERRDPRGPGDASLFPPSRR